MGTMIKAIETEYNGYRFRSRLEARWAVFFDQAGITYEYEPEGFELEDGTRYLPDFYLPELDTHVEVKSEREGAWEDIKRAKNMLTWGGPIRRLLIHSDIPKGFDGGMWHFPCFYWEGTCDRVAVGWWFYSCIGDGKVEGHISSAGYIPPWDYDEYDQPKTCFRQTRPLSLKAVSDRILRKESGWHYREDAYDEEEMKCQYFFNQNVFDALIAAQQARFEYGENGGVS